MTSKKNNEAALAQNELVAYLDSELVDTQFKDLKNLFRDCPLNPKDLQNIQDMTGLFKSLETAEEISVGNYEYFSNRLKRVNPRLATEVRKKEAEIKQILNGGPSEYHKETARYESQQQSAGNDQQMSEVVPVEETEEGTAGNFHRRENTGLSFTYVEALGTSGLRKSVGIIKIKKDGHLSGSGTGFRVGRNYLMTAYHVFEEVIKKVWKLALRKARQSSEREAIYKEINRLFRILPDKIESGDIEPSQQPLPFGKLFECLHKHGVQIEVFNTMFKQATRVAFGVKDGETTAGEFHFEYDIPFADAAHDVLVLQIIEKEGSTLPPPIPLEEDMVRETGHLIGYPEGQTEVDLRSDIQCNIYVNPKNLQNDVTKAIKWWKDDKKLLVEDDYAVCRDTCSENGKMFLHTSKEFEHRCSGSPVVAIINDKPVVQLMYLRGYPEFCYAEKNFPPPQYLFEAGVEMPLVTQLLRKICPDIMEN